MTKVTAKPGTWKEVGGLENLVILEMPATTPGMVVVAKADEAWQKNPELRWQTWPDRLVRTAAEVVPIRTDTRQPGVVARNQDGEQISAGDCGRLLSLEQGFEFDLAVTDTSFRVTIRHLGPMPEMPIDLFIVVNDGGNPFLLGCARSSWGMDIRYNAYINSRLEAAVRQLSEVDLVEIDAAGQRTYRVPLRHSFE